MLHSMHKTPFFNKALNSDRVQASKLSYLYPFIYVTCIDMWKSHYVVSTILCHYPPNYVNKFVFYVVWISKTIVKVIQIVQPILSDILMWQYLDGTLNSHSLLPILRCLHEYQKSIVCNVVQALLGLQFQLYSNFSCCHHQIVVRGQLLIMLIRELPYYRNTS